VNDAMRRVELAEAHTSIGARERERKGVGSQNPFIMAA
jgi:hypothetical protein